MIGLATKGVMSGALGLASKGILSFSTYNGPVFREGWGIRIDKTRVEIMASLCLADVASYSTETAPSISDARIEP